MSKTPMVGDVFLIPIDDVRYGIGQIAGDWKGELYVVIYDKVVSAEASADEIEGASLQFAALSLDAKLYNGDWRVVGNRLDTLEALPQPWFKVGFSEQTYVESRDRSVFRPANAAEDARLRLRNVVAPVRLERALKARHGIGDWHPLYEELTSDYAFESARLIAG